MHPQLYLNGGFKGGETTFMASKSGDKDVRKITNKSKSGDKNESKSKSGDKDVSKGKNGDKDVRLRDVEQTDNQA